MIGITGGVAVGVVAVGDGAAVDGLQQVMAVGIVGIGFQITAVDVVRQPAFLDFCAITPPKQVKIPAIKK